MPVKQPVRFDELKATRQLPSPTGVALAVLRLTEQENATIPEISRILQTDPALAGKILKYSNSAYFGATRPVVSIPAAVIRLGMRVVRQLALGFSVLSNYRKGKCEGFDYMGFWSRSLACAIGAQALSRATRMLAPDEVFTCGLLGKVGLLAMACVHPQEYSEVLRVCEDQSSSEELLRLERQSFATDHNEITAFLFRDWGLPEMFVEGARCHDRPDSGDLTEGSPAHQLARLLHLAQHLARVCVSGEPSRSHLVTDLFALGAQYGLGREDLIKLCDSVAREWQEWGSIFDVPTRSLPSFADLADAAREPVVPAIESVPEPAAAPPSSLRVLAVDGDPAELVLLEQFLKSNGHRVIVARTGREAMRLSLETHPQLIITDSMTPEIDGLELCRALRQTEAGRQIYLVVLTRKQTESLIVQAFEAGADDCIAKPFCPRLLAARIHAGLRIIQMQEESHRDKEEIRRYVAELGIANRKLEQAALTDLLTGLPNRRHAMNRLGEEWITSSRTLRPLACMVVDIDHFKQVNDLFGHDIGDMVLRSVSGTLRESLRSGDVVCRMGGEEFVVICPETDLAGAQLCAERLRNAVHNSLIEQGGTQHSITVSIGIALRDATMHSVDTLLKAADQAVYMAKQRGRNQISLMVAHESRTVPGANEPQPPLSTAVPVSSRPRPA